jgi:hypothetical protein
MAAGLIYLVILGMWVAYFLPKWINRHEDATAKAGQRYTNALALASTGQFEFTEAANSGARVQARRRAFTGILVLSALSFLAAAAGFLTWLVTLIPVSAFAIYLVSVRRQINSERKRRQRLAALEQITSARVEQPKSAPISFAPYERSVSTTPVASQASFDQQITPEHWIPLSERAFDADRPGVVVIPRQNNSDVDLTANKTWAPTAIPKPTYASAPKAIVPKRIIDLTTPGTWSAEQELIAELVTNDRDQLFDQELAEQAARSEDRAIS